jgi:hypothetical protein
VNVDTPELRLIHAWLDSWAGIGLVVGGMWHQGYQLSLGDHGASRWIVVFYRGGGGHEPVAAAGAAQEPTAWTALVRGEGRSHHRCRVANSLVAPRLRR